MKVVSYLTIFFTVALSTQAYSQSSLSDLDFLIGTWQVENKNSYEVWHMDSVCHLTGGSYKMMDGNTKWMETLCIKKINDQIIYEATVPDQNDGKTIPFVLNSSEKEWYSFENATHDFPKKVRYQKVTDQHIKVEVLGEGDKGFSYNLYPAPAH